MKTLVFGGTGWVGHHIAAAFHLAGHDVTICSRGRKETYTADVPDVRRVTANKGDSSEVAGVLSERFDVIVDSVPTEDSVAHICAHAIGLKHYIHCSSTGGYAPLPFLPGDETMPYDHFMGGWKNKCLVDAKALDLFNRQGFPATVIRPPYITGPGLLPLDNQGGRRPDFLADILAGKPLDLPNDGQALLQPIHVEDLAAAFLLAAEAPRHSVGQIYNICLEKAVTLNRYLELNADALGCTVEIKHLPVNEMFEKYGDAIDKRGLYFMATHMCYDIGKARDQLGYEPLHTTESAITETARWAATDLQLEVPG
jgi:nucleoside-diphosphate-sugar epimerase